MDLKDRQILNLLQEDCSLSLQALAEQVNLSPTPCWKRIKRLEEAGVIRSRVALLDATKVNLGVSVFVHIKTQHHDSRWLENFAVRVTELKEVVECYRMAGEWDYLLRVVVADIQAFDGFYKELVNRVEGISNVTSSFAMEEIKNTTCLPLL
ncbi:Lrp/AsnC family transcriptional regulator [Aliamphritea hakodatensis]|uniref:Lrp/AsnC family transcriptional regulator n=1 Tax=Aliamphritea hakodatensis TaxID=2895352 RepID=UPI0022FD3F3D|nr:Lrp/AsnC family transcriptional regulator [Aliamphritea hakodatensis]